MKLHIDRELPVAIGAQVRGIIEYGIVSGELSPGEQLPSVRGLAKELGVAPMTIAEAYRELRRSGLIKTQRSLGTFVADRNDVATVPQRRLSTIHRRVDLLIRDALAIGLTSADITGLVQTHLVQRGANRKARRILMVGMFPEPTRDYAENIQAILGHEFRVEPWTLGEVRKNKSLRSQAQEIELVITFPNRRRAIAAILPFLRVVALRFVPSEKTQRALAALAPSTRVGIVSHLAEFLSMLKVGVQRFAPQVNNLRAAVVETPQIESLLGWSEFVVLSTGAESVLKRLRPGVRAIEYRYSPDASDIEQTLVPLLARRSERGSDAARPSRLANRAAHR